MTTRIAVLPGDGIGPEVIEAVLTMLPAGVELVWIHAGSDRYLDTGEVLLDQEVDAIADCDALLLGAVGDPRVPDGVLERGILLRLRKELDLYVNVRPFEELGLVFVRENTEGLYAGLGSATDEVAIEMSLNNREAVRRCVAYAFGMAERRERRLT
ncbi:MAG: 3-isopropylmalate dehydrogenase, partial [Actinobacteria bacterium]|nr:3-isopropylmalate dehydrogenase [Actinomycetota bacterium]